MLGTCHATGGLIRAYKGREVSQSLLEGCRGSSCHRPVSPPLGLRLVTALSSRLQDSLGPAGGLAAAVLGPRHPVAVLMEEMVEANMSAGALRQRREQQKLAEVSPRDGVCCVVLAGCA